MDEIVLKEEHAECVNAAVGWWEKETITNYEKLKNPLDWFKNLSFRKIKGKELKKFHEALTQIISADLERHEFVQLYVRNGLPYFMLFLKQYGAETAINSACKPQGFLGF